MNSNKGIFEGFPAAGSGAGQSFPSPFTTVAEDQPARNPFAPVEPAAPFSPFAGADGEVGRPIPEPGKPARLPERRRPGGESPFQVAEPSEGFGFDAPAGGFATAPFQPQSPFNVVTEEPAVALQAVPMVQAYQPPPQAAPPVMPPVSPFQVAPAAELPPPPAPAPAPAPVAVEAPAPLPPPPAPVVQQAPAPAPAPVSQPVLPPVDPSFAAWAPLAPVAPPPVTPPPAPAFAMPPAPTLPEPASTGIRQLELRAIFGVDRELSADEILQRLRGLAGIRSLLQVGGEQLAAFENLRRCLGSLAPAGAPMRLMFGNSPVELVREGRVVLAVVTDGSFAPGVRETIMIGARELDRMQ